MPPLKIIEARKKVCFPLTPAPDRACIPSRTGYTQSKGVLRPPLASDPDPKNVGMRVPEIPRESPYRGDIA